MFLQDILPDRRFYPPSDKSQHASSANISCYGFAKISDSIAWLLITQGMAAPHDSRGRKVTQESSHEVERRDKVGLVWIRDHFPRPRRDSSEIIECVLKRRGHWGHHDKHGIP